MIEFWNVTKTFRSRGQRRTVLDEVSFALPPDRNFAVIGRNGAGKSTLLGLMSGALSPNEGSVLRSGNISWPLAFAGGFHPLLTGRQNAKFVARIFGVDIDEMVDEVQDFAELGTSFDLPINTYSQGMRARLAFGVSMAVNFDCYLVDEIIGVGDIRFREKCRAVFQDRLRHSQVIMASHSESGLREFCDSAILVENGAVVCFDSLEEGLEAYKELMLSDRQEAIGV